MKTQAIPNAEIRAVAKIALTQNEDVDSITAEAHEFFGALLVTRDDEYCVCHWRKGSESGRTAHIGFRSQSDRTVYIAYRAKKAFLAKKGGAS